MDTSLYNHDLISTVKDVHRCFPTGVTIVTTSIGDTPYGLAVNAFSSISLTPPLVLVCVAGSAATYPRLFEREHLAVNVLAHDQATLASKFAKSGSDKFQGVAWTPGANNTPILSGVSAYLELAIEKRVPVHTHSIFIGRVTSAFANDCPPLIYLGGRFFDGAELHPAS